MKKKRTKIDFINEQIALKTDDIWRMELVRDINLAKEPNTVVNDRGDTAAMQVDAATKRIGEIEIEITWLRNHLKELSA